MGKHSSTAAKDKTMEGSASVAFKAGDIVSLQSPVSFGVIEANGEQLAGLNFQANEVVILGITGDPNDGGTVYVAPATNFDGALLRGAIRISPQQKGA